MNLISGEMVISTGDFVSSLHNVHATLVDALKGFEDTAARSRGASLLLHRLMFLYFLQQRGLLVGDVRYLQHHLASVLERGPGDESFYRGILSPLFAGRSSEGFSVPFPALFISSTDECDAAFSALPDNVFVRIFKLFDEYRWQTDNQSAVASAVLTPEMLGPLFEREISQRELGAYYTPADVTDYIARNTLLPFLLTRPGIQQTGGELITRTIENQPERYIFSEIHRGCERPLPLEVAEGLHDVTRRQHWQTVAAPEYALPGEIWREVVSRRAYLEEISASLRQGGSENLERMVTWNLDLHQLVLDVLHTCQQPVFLETFYQSLRSLAVLDPTCGSGAFLFAALSLLESLYAACLTRMQELLVSLTEADVCYSLFVSHLTEVGEPATWRYTILNWICQDNLYGVDLMAEAVEIGRLRLFLRLLVALPAQHVVSFSAQFGQHICVGNSLTAELERDELQVMPGNSGGGQQAFQWSRTFSRIMDRGGFDVVMGNPPYVAYKQTGRFYEVGDYKTLDSGNLYALTMERSLRLLAPEGRCGMVVPASATCTDGYRSLQQLLLAQQDLHIASFSDQCGRLFSLSHPRLCIILYTKSLPMQTRPARVFTTPYIKLGRGMRTHLFQRLHYTEVTHQVRPGIIPRCGLEVEKAIQRKLADQAHCLDYYLLPTDGHAIYYTRKLSWFVQVTPFIPLILDEQGRVRLPSELKSLSFVSQRYTQIAFAALNSNLFYWLLSMTSDCRNLNLREIKNLPLDLESMSQELQQKLETLAGLLEHDLQANSCLRPMRFKNGGKLIIQCMYPARSKHLIDKIDHALAVHYGFTAEEEDFLLHCDGKFRHARRSIVDRPKETSSG